jgi:hypothetical protein
VADDAHRMTGGAAVRAGTVGGCLSLQPRATTAERPGHQSR